jgi:GTPase involved in cell partitioning and DNA repair
MNRRSASCGLVIKHKKPDEIKPKEVIELLEKQLGPSPSSLITKSKDFVEKHTERQNEEVVEKYTEPVLEENKPDDRLENIKKETIEKLIKQQSEEVKPKNKKKKKVVYVSESDDETEE